MSEFYRRIMNLFYWGTSRARVKALYISCQFRQLVPGGGENKIQQSVKTYNIPVLSF